MTEKTMVQTSANVTRIVGIAGSWRRGSYNAALLRAARGLMPEEATLEVASIRDIPPYDGDLEAESGVPEVVRELKDAIAGADGVLVATPEYNNSIPGTLKNAIDWTTRPVRDIPRVWGARPVAIIGASPGSGRTRMAQAAWLPVFRRLHAQLFLSLDIQLGEAGKLFDGDGVLVDERTRGDLTTYLARFTDFARAISSLSQPLAP
jgi:chromate reductase, NAD(P)H dehydrogenase (quinone)